MQTPAQLNPKPQRRPFSGPATPAGGGYVSPPMPLTLAQIRKYLPADPEDVKKFAEASKGKYKIKHTDPRNGIRTYYANSFKHWKATGQYKKPIDMSKPLKDAAKSAFKKGKQFAGLFSPKRKVKTEVKGENRPLLEFEHKGLNLQDQLDAAQDQPESNLLPEVKQQDNDEDKSTSKEFSSSSGLRKSSGSLSSVPMPPTPAPPAPGTPTDSDYDSEEKKHDDVPTTTHSGGEEHKGGGGPIDYDQMAAAITKAFDTSLFGGKNKTNKKVTASVPELPGDPESNRGGRLITDSTTEPLSKSQPGRELGLTVQDESTATLRPLYGIAGGAEVIPPVREQLRSDIEFDLFNLVQPGHGEGSDNKLFLYQEGREKNIRFKRPLYTPNVWLGPSNYQHPLPWQWQNVKAVSDVQKSVAEVSERVEKVARLIDRMGEKTTEAFGRDVGEAPAAISSSGLKRDVNSPFEPVIQNRHPWTPILDPPGKDLERQRGWKRSFSALRDPDAVEVQVRNGGPTLRKRRALEVILP